MMLNTFASNAKMFRSLMISPKLNQRNAWTHVQGGLTHRKKTISIAILDTTESSCFAQCPDGTNYGLHNHGWESQMPQRGKSPLNPHKPLPTQKKKTATTMARMSRTTICRTRLFQLISHQAMIKSIDWNSCCNCTTWNLTGTSCIPVRKSNVWAISQ